MGFFDYYKPVPSLKCPMCENVLDDWQGKNGTCALFVWEQGVAYPVSQEADECNIDEVDRGKFRLPERFEIYTLCKNCPDYWITAECKTEDEIWKEIENTRLDKIPKLPKKWINQK